MNSSYTENGRFIMLCSAGLLILAEEFYQIKPSIDVSYNYENAFRLACKHNHLNVAKWLMEIKPTINIHIWSNIVFHNACKKNHIELAKWWLSLINSNDNYRDYMSIASKYGNEDLVNYISNFIK
jgi:hypothetical protein